MAGRTSCSRRLAVCSTALLMVAGCALFTAGLILLVRSPPECDGLPLPGAGQAGNASSRRQLHEAALGAATGYAAPLTLAPTGAAVLVAASAAAALARTPSGPDPTWASSRRPPAAAVLQSAPQEPSSRRRGGASSGARRRLSCAPAECVDLVVVGGGMAAAHREWLATGDVGVDALLSALTDWYPLLDIGGRNSAIQSLSWAEFESTAAQVKLIMDGYYHSGAVPEGRPPREQVRQPTRGPR